MFEHKLAIISLSLAKKSCMYNKLRILSPLFHFNIRNISDCHVNVFNEGLPCLQLCRGLRMPSPEPRLVFHIGNLNNLKNFSTNLPTEDIDTVTYEEVCQETLDSLCEFFDDIIEESPALKKADVSFGDGVLTVNLDNHGTYVINRQSPNKQIWLSSPTSGPKRYDFVKSRNGWVYRHNNETLHSLLQQELSSITKQPVDLSHCSHCGDFK